MGILAAEWLVRVTTMAKPSSVELIGLGAGERETMALSRELGPESLLLIDEGKSRREAERVGVKHMGVLGVLDKAAASARLHLPTALERLLQTNFFVSPNLLRMLLVEDALRRKL